MTSSTMTGGRTTGVPIFVGTPSEGARRVVECGRVALAAGTAAAQPGQRLSAISRAIESAIRQARFFVVEQYVGHGIGREMHEDPQVPNFYSDAFDRSDPLLQPGLVLAIEPMVCTSAATVRTLSDGWTVATSDGALACHWENTVAVTVDGPRVLTAVPGETW